MENLKTWSTKIKREIDEKKDQIYKRDYKFFKLDRLGNIAEHTEEFAPDCTVCEASKKDIEDIVERIPDYLAGETKKRREYEKRNEKMVKHLQKIHSLYPKNYFISVYSLAGFTGGIVLGAGISYLINPEMLFRGVILGFIAGLFLGRILGAKKDKQQKADNLTL
ncbi:MAG: hypothetical protein U9N85_00020 [Bacteroidota bacterium]|nr:hypothetical protein [Bacteroidota bacterium]